MKIKIGYISVMEVRKEGNVLLTNALNTFHLRLYGVGHMVKNHSGRERGNPLLPIYVILSLINRPCHRQDTIYAVIDTLYIILSC